MSVSKLHMTKHISHAFAGYYVHQIYGFSDTKPDNINITSQQTQWPDELKKHPAPTHIPWSHRRPSPRHMGGHTSVFAQLSQLLAASRRVLSLSVYPAVHCHSLPSTRAKLHTLVVVVVVVVRLSRLQPRACVWCKTSCSSAANCPSVRPSVAAYLSQFQFPRRASCKQK